MPNEANPKGYRRNLGIDASDAWYRELFEHGLGYLCTHTLDGMLLTVNPAAADALGYEPSEMAGQPFERFLAPSVRHFFPQYLERLRSEERATGLLRMLTKSGEELLWLFRNTVVDQQNSVPYVLGYAQDVTALRQTIQSERQAASDYRALVEHAGYGIFRATMSGDFLMVNPALVDMLGYGSLRRRRGAGASRRATPERRQRRGIRDQVEDAAGQAHYSLCQRASGSRFLGPVRVL